ncbi:biotin--[acetyl-CoA-carboxylase] ligase [Psychroserpens sp. Hel_I_66]|uniref:biotin--[acetyl-CoA-carboxylase] ligase n=1 Tax=Psychroserpens sp. Hel_I_66 TaxID=1250004 RepID=UPI000648F2E9|nr:biotin--[acetyl-CoA-carboxylase] ligase [Psychroserpens sp. Hel_I_66]
MHIIKLNAIDSTNTFLRQLSSKEALVDYTVVLAEKQTNGRGQMGTKWSSQSGKNLMASVFVDVSFLNIEHSFGISMAISLSISQVLKDHQIKNIKVKWPNDILAEQKKISGILIENVIKNNNLQASIIGFGLNINQQFFDELPNATSMKILSGRTYSKEEIVKQIITKFKVYIEMLKTNKFTDLKKIYENELFRKDKPSTFEDIEGHLFTGYIKGISNTGHLKILVEDEKIKAFDLKQIRLLY